MANPFAKSRKTGNPYAIYRAGDMVWQVLKTYKQPSSEDKDPYARWMVAAKSRATFGSYEIGDTYKCEVTSYGLLVAAEPAWIEAYRPLPTPEEYLADA